MTAKFTLKDITYHFVTCLRALTTGWIPIMSVPEGKLRFVPKTSYLNLQRPPLPPTAVADVLAIWGGRWGVGWVGWVGGWGLGASGGGGWWWVVGWWWWWGGGGGYMRSWVRCCFWLSDYDYLIISCDVPYVLEIILDMASVNERRHYIVTSSLTG